MTQQIDALMAQITLLSNAAQAAITNSAQLKQKLDAAIAGTSQMAATIASLNSQISALQAAHDAAVQTALTTKSLSDTEISQLNQAASTVHNVAQMLADAATVNAPTN